MFRFARYFFSVFLITTVIPLIMMFFWTHRQMEHMGQEQDLHMLDVGVNQLKITIDNYLRLQQSYILEKMQNLPVEKMSLTQLQDILKIDKIEAIYDERESLFKSYYELIPSKETNKPELYSVLIAPAKNPKNNGLKIWKKVDYSLLRPTGPFDVEVYAGDKTDSDSLITVAKDPFMPSHPDMHDPGHRPPFPSFGHPPKPFDNPPPGFLRNKSNHHATIKISDNNGKTVATLLISAMMQPKPMAPQKPIEKQFGLIILFAGSILSLLTGFYISKNFVKPLLVLSNASKKVQEGDLSFELKTDIKQEQIINTFNNFNQMIRGLSEKNELRRSFITSLTHDLRTPLIAQERSLEFISNKFEDLGSQDDYELAKSLEKNNKHLLRMVNLILESYQFDSAELNLIISNISVSEILDNCFEKLKPLASEKNIQLVNNISADFPLIKGDSTSFKRIFLNLISNAIESVAQNGKVEIGTELFNDHIKIYIEDNGPGISQKDLAHIFDRYYTGKSFERKLGSGLGLYVCKKLTEMHNGQITVESEIDKYTRFTINLPLNN
jgi:signal transduction histidine kinase